MIIASEAGAGKSVIWSASLSMVHVHVLILFASSAVIEDIRVLQKSGLASLAFFYCDFRDDKKKDRRELLSSLLVQLGEQSDAYSTILSKFYEAHRRGSQQSHASDSELADCLKNMLKLPGQAPVYIVADALDECPVTTGLVFTRKKVLELLEELVILRIPNLRICVTSRPEADIIEVLENLAFFSVSLHGESGQVQDIAEYVRSFVHASREMRRWKATDKQLVIDEVANKADGMYVIHAAITYFALVHISNVGSVGRFVNLFISVAASQGIFGMHWRSYQRRWTRHMPALWKKSTSKIGSMHTAFFSVLQQLPDHFVRRNSQSFSHLTSRPDPLPHFWLIGGRKTRKTRCYRFVPLCSSLSNRVSVPRLSNLRTFQSRST
jgi:hypothetical protein